jgi:FMN-dependent NADH-azoreductase
MIVAGIPCPHPFFIAFIMNILHIDSACLGDNSASRQLSAAAVEALCAGSAETCVVYRDLSAAPLSHVNGPLMQVMRSEWNTALPMNAELSAEALLAESLLAEFLAADVLVLGAPMFNLSVPSTLKAWLDRVLLQGRTFDVDADGRTVGLAKGKRVVLVSTRGGQAHEMLADHQEAYLKAVFAVMGVEQVDVVRAEGIALGAELRAQAIQGALRQAASLRAL